MTLEAPTTTDPTQDGTADTITVLDPVAGGVASETRRSSAAEVS